MVLDKEVLPFTDGSKGIRKAIHDLMERDFIACNVTGVRSWFIRSSIALANPSLIISRVCS